MSARTFQLFSRNSSVVLIVFLIVTLPAYAQLFPKARPDNVIKPKNIHGVVQDLRGSPLPGARVYLKDMKSKVVRTLEADQSGEYKVFALSPTVDYELYAEFKGKASEKLQASSRREAPSTKLQDRISGFFGLGSWSLEVYPGSFRLDW